MPFFGKGAPRGAIPGWVRAPPQAPPASGAAHKSSRVSSASPSCALTPRCPRVPWQSPSLPALSSTCYCINNGGVAEESLGWLSGLSWGGRAMLSPGTWGHGRLQGTKAVSQTKGCLEKASLSLRGLVLLCFVSLCVLSPVQAARGKPRVLLEQLLGAPACFSPPLFPYLFSRQDGHPQGDVLPSKQSCPLLSASPKPPGKDAGLLDNSRAPAAFVLPSRAPPGAAPVPG